MKEKDGENKKCGNVCSLQLRTIDKICVRKYVYEDVISILTLTLSYTFVFILKIAVLLGKIT